MNLPVWLPLSVALGLALSVPARAQNEALLDCATVAVTPAFRDKLADAMLGKANGNGEEDALIAELVNVAEKCAAQHKLAEEPAAAYFEYSIARLPRDAFILRLGKLGVSAQVIDDVLDFGPGRGNPVLSGSLSQTQIDALVSALAAQGMVTDAVEESTWHMVGAYAAATSLMWQAHRRLR